MGVISSGVLFPFPNRAPKTIDAPSSTSIDFPSVPSSCRIPLHFRARFSRRLAVVSGSAQHTVQKPDPDAFTARFFDSALSLASLEWVEQTLRTLLRMLHATHSQYHR